MATSENSLRDRQIVSLKKILNLNETVQSSETDEAHANGLLAPVAPILDAEGNPIWKVLVFDDLGRDVISSVMRVSDLRSMGVTMHMHISNARHAIPDVPVIYLLEPTEQNLQGITTDLSKGLYSPAYINFLSSLPRVLLEDFATQTATSGTSDQIAQLFDQYLNFIVAEPDLFSLGMQKHHTYWALNSGKTSDAELDLVVDRIVSGLFSVIVTMGVIPIIRCPKDAAAEMVAARLDRKLRDHILNSKDNLFSNKAASGTPTSRPVLILLDRNVDLIPMLSHSWTYQSLVHDVLDMKLNRITIESPVDEKNPARGTTKKAYDLNSNDFFWSKNAGVPFPQVAEDIDAELTKYKEDTASITKKTGVADLEDLQNDTGASAQHLKAAITLLPEMRERKGILDMHMNILAALLSGIKDRQLDNYFQMEESIMKQPKAQIMEIIKDDNKGTDPRDKLRLFIIWFLSTEQEVPRADFEGFEKALEAAGADVSSLVYVRQVRATTKMTQLTTINNTNQQASSDLFGRFSSISTRLTDRLKETGVPSGLSSNFDSLISGVKNFLPADRDLTITKIVESIMDPSTASSSAIAKTEHYLYFDPRSANARGTMPPPSAIRSGTGATAPGGMPGAQGGQPASFGQRRQGFSDAVVFTVGGGSMEEYGNLQEWVSRTGRDRGKKRVVYGSTEMVNAGEFVTEELERLGKELSSCDGRNPCSNCESFAAHCQYQPSKFRANNYNQMQSHKAMQRRLAELEAILEKVGYEDGPAVNRPSPESTTGTGADEDQPSRRNSMIYPVSNAMDERRGPGQNPMLLMLRDLSIGALGEYIGATSQVTLSRLISSMTRSKDSKPSAMTESDPSLTANTNEGTTGGWEHLSPKSASTANQSQSAGKVDVNLAEVPLNIADKLFRGYITYISTRWPVIHSPYITQLHETRASVTDVYEVTVLHLVYAIGGRFLETAGVTGNFYSEQHCEKALENLDEIIQSHGGLRSIQILILLAIYNLRSPKGPGVWTFVGLAMRQCIDLGLHRQTRLKWPLIEEMRRRVFWTCYCLDRQVSIILGRPFAISDRDIDVELPTDVDEDIEDIEHLRKLQQQQRERTEIQPPPVSTSMTVFIYMCRLRSIESDIQQTIYRVDKAPLSTIKADVDGFIARLEEWKAQLPLDAHKLPNLETMCVDGYDSYMVYYHQCMRFLLFPVILSSDMADVPLLKKCAEACAGVCQTYKKLHQKVSVGFSVMALHSIFIAGLTLLYCTWASPKEVFSIGTSNGLNACSVVMYVIAERWTGARKYRDVFDAVKQAVLETIEAGGDEPRQAIDNLRSHVISALKTAGSNGEGVCRAEFSAMVNDMAGTSEQEHQENGGESTILDYGNTFVAGEAAEWDGSRSRYEAPIDSRAGNEFGGFEGFEFAMQFEPMNGMPLGFPGDLDIMGSDSMSLTPGRWAAGGNARYT